MSIDKKVKRSGKGRSPSKPKRGSLTPYEALVAVAEEMKRNGGPIWIKPLDEVIRDLAEA